MYQGLRYLGKDVTLLRYEGQGHGFKGAAMTDFWRRENGLAATLNVAISPPYYYKHRA
ncbi:MAG TPA: hypothetical protein VJV96_14890 [Candidatus Angelobacter sp.]|nr:hypothetical protein [Candidatus Angelobacter sp.]